MPEKSGISISVSGGNASFGNISQGDNNTNFTGQVSVDAAVAPLFDETIEAVEHYRSVPEVSMEEVAQLRDELRALKTLVCSEDEEQKAKASGFLARLKEQYSWAANALSSLANGLTVMTLI